MRERNHRGGYPISLPAHCRESACVQYLSRFFPNFPSMLTFESIYPLPIKRAMEWMYKNCSTTAQRGALDWWKNYYAASKPVYETLYASVPKRNSTRLTSSNMS